MANIAITGGSGLLAVNWALLRREIDNIFLLLNKREIFINGTKTLKTNLSSLEDIVSFIKTYKIDLIIHTAGITNIEECQKNIPVAKFTNIQLSKNLAEATKICKVKMVHISSDHLFDGTSSFYSEEDNLNPLNVYAQTKAKAENEVLQIDNSALIIRTNFFGCGPSYRRSFSDFIIDSLSSNTKIELFNDVFFSPIFIPNLVEIIHKLIATSASGIFHVVGNDRLSKYEFGIRLSEKFNLDSSLIMPLSIKQRKGLVVRPLDMSLSNKKCTSYINSEIVGLDKFFDAYKSDLYTHFCEEINKI